MQEDQQAEQTGEQGSSAQGADQSSGQAADQNTGQAEQAGQAAAEQASGSDQTETVDEVGEAVAQSFDSFSENLSEFIEEPNVDTAWEAFGPPLISLGQGILGLVVLIVIVSFLGRWVERLIRATLTKAKLEATVTQFLSKTARYALWIVAVPIAFEMFGVKTTSLAAVIGAAGLAIGLAMQGSLSNIAAGVMLLLLRPFKLGDWVQLADELGIVEDIGIFYTRITTFQNHLIILPNSEILGAKIENITESDTVRVDVPIGVAYGSDLKEAHEALARAGKGDYPGKKLEDKADVILTGFGDSSIDFIVRAWCDSRKFLHARTGICNNINDELKAAGLEIPFPQRDLHIRDSVKLPVGSAD